MNISKTAKAFAVAAAVGLTSQVFGATTNQWWSENFDSVADIAALTNTTYSAGYASNVLADIRTFPKHPVGLRLETVEAPPKSPFCPSPWCVESKVPIRLLWPLQGTP